MNGKPIGWIALAVLGGLASAAQAETRRQPPYAEDVVQRPIGVDARVPFLNHHGVRDWRADGREGLYVMDARRQWYRATLMGPCNNLPFAQTIGFDSGAMDVLDRHAAIIVDGERCQFSSFVTSNPPPPRQRRRP